jgi:hypothetical protein
MRGSTRVAVFKTWTDYLAAWLERRDADMLAGISGLHGLTIQKDPEAMFMQGWMLCDVGRHQEGLEFLQRVVARGYFPAATLASSAHFDRLRGEFAFQKILADAVAGRQKALNVFRETGGERLLGELVHA